MQPNRDVQRRQENTLQVWILEAKGMPQKRRYFCELLLDGALYFRTTSKLKTDICFWGEQYEIKHLVKLDQIIVRLYREADRKKKRESNTLVGCVEIPAQALSSKHAVEKW
ncbi:unnamed protein product [Soboliphyme baturini]|uniref:C2 domain-containing protein n=1 Tax=Soboliphyme baturini TaxID=241478 RepID=A0A183II94_9BILA|nr:unnamed protein product [Soboliphyme baturini]